MPRTRCWARREIGIAHWSDHVDAERRASRGDISVAKRQAIFKETRLKGPGDQKRYAAAVRRYERLDASCGKAKGADEKIDRFAGEVPGAAQGAEAGDGEGGRRR